MDHIVVGLDLGSSKTVCVIANRDESGKLAIVGVGKAKSDGVRSGVIVSIRAAVKSIQEAIEAAEASGWEVKEVVAGLAGGTIEGINSRGVVAVSGQEEIQEHDVERVIDAAKAVLIPLDREILHVLPQEFIVDDARKIKNPIDMMGIRLESEVHIVTASMAVSRNLVQGINNAGFGVSEIVLDTLASSQAVLSREEKDVGVLLVDLGAGTTDVVLHFEGAPHFSKVYSIGSERVTKDIAQVLQIPDEEAERIKIKHGNAWIEGLSEDAEVIIRGVGSRPAFALRRSQVAQIIQARMEEIFQLIRKDVARTGLLEQLGGGIVLTGGGAHLEGVTELAREVFGKPARMGVPMSVAGLEESWQRPEYTAAVGLVLWGQEANSNAASAPPEGDSAKKRPTKPPTSGGFSKVWDFIKKNFI